MSDFIVQIGKRVTPQLIKDRLEGRPGMARRTARYWDFAWGSVVIQAPYDSAYEPIIRDDVLYGCAGRPCILGFDGFGRGPGAMSREIAERWDSGREFELFDQLSGTHALLRCSSNELRILTDRMGAFPVYCAIDGNGRTVAVGTDIETLARIADRLQDWDLVSLAELLVFNNITFPYSSRNGLEELPPASISLFDLTNPHSTLNTHILWEPAEPSSWQPDGLMVDRTEEALKTAGVEATRGSRSIAVTLSGGLDSRAVLSAIPEGLELSAITYVTHENNETRVAREVAQAAGIHQLLAQRGEDYFADLLLSRGPQLLGTERRAAVHGFCVLDSDLHEQFDVILGGQLSDTFLKNHYMPFEQREAFRPRGPREILRDLVGLSSPVTGPSILSTIGRHLALVHLSPDFRELVISRRSTRLEAVEVIRPETAKEWSRFWPTSRQDDLAHVLGNTRLFSFDTLFMQKAIIDVASQLSPHQRYAGLVANQAFNRLFGKLGRIENANTGYPAANGQSLNRWQRRRHALKHPKRIPGAAPWNDVQTSWADNLALQRNHPAWAEVRSFLVTSPAIEVLDQLTDQPARDLIRKYADGLPPTFNQMLIQLGISIAHTNADEKS